MHLLYRFRNQDYEPLDEDFGNYFFKVLESHMRMVYMHAHTYECKCINDGARTQVCTCTQRPEVNAVSLCQPFLSQYIVTESLYVLEFTYSPSLANQFAGEMYCFSQEDHWLLHIFRGLYSGPHVLQQHFIHQDISLTLRATLNVS